MFTCLDLGFAMLGVLRGLVLVGLWGHLLVFGCIHSTCGLFRCNHLWEHIPVMLVCLLHTLSPHRAISCLPCLLCATHLAFFASLYFCTLAYMFVHEYLCLLVSSSLIPTISCKFTPVFDTWHPESLLGILLNGTCVVCTPIQWNYRHPIQTYICHPRTPLFVWQYVFLPFRVLSMFVFPPFGSLHMLSLPLCYLLCVSAGCFLCLLHVHAQSKDTWSEGMTP